MMRVHCEIFESMFKSWVKLCAEATDFASELAPEQIISISHSCDQSNGVICIWYWGEDEEPGDEL